MIEVANVAQMKNTNENAALKPNPAHGLRTELARKIVFLVGKEENRITDIPGVSLHRRTSPTPPCRMTYHPGIIVVAQGSKRVNLEPTSFIYDESHFLVTAVDLPIVSWVAAAADEVPCLVLSRKLDMFMVRELLGREEIHVARYVGWHKVVQGLLRHASYSITMNVYDEAMSEEKRNAHRGVIQQLNRSVTRSALKPAISQWLRRLASPTGFEPVLPP